MKNLLKYIVLILTLISCSSKFEVVEITKSNNVVLKKGKTLGVILNDKWIYLLAKNIQELYIPNVSDINIAEDLLVKKLKNINDGVNQGGNCPIIHKNLSNYRRQYLGYIDNEGNKILIANFNWDKTNFFDYLMGYTNDYFDDWKENYISFCDGCSFHWDIKINLTKSELFDLNINGGA